VAEKAPDPLQLALYTVLASIMVPDTNGRLDPNPQRVMMA
jgi:hypothetical protein